MTETAAEGTRWRGYSHKDLYLMLHDGPGAAASAEPSRRWSEIASTLTEVGQDLQKALDLAGGGWTGRAAGAAYERLSTTVRWAADAGTDAAGMRTSVEDQGDHIAKARADMPKPEDVPATQPDPTAAAAVQVLQTQTDAEPAEAAASSAEQRAVEVMTTYEQNTNATTAALATFTTPPPLLPRTDMHQHHGGGLSGLLPTVAAGLLGGGHGGPSRHDEHRNDWRGNQGSGHRENWHSPVTSGSSSGWQETRRPTPATPAAPPPAPGRMTGASLDPLMAPGMGGGREQQRSGNRGGAQQQGAGAGNGSGGNGSGGNSAPGAGPRSGAANPGLPPTPHELQQQAAAASQAAATAHPGTGAPIAPGAAAPAAGGQDKVAVRRFGMDAIGSSQWFGDDEEPVAGQSPKRRFDLRESADGAEPGSILDDEHHVPPTVIGEGGR
jgi:hypothetical protein